MGTTKTFETCLPALLWELMEWPAFAGLKVVCVVRDLRGCLRLVLDGAPDAIQVSALEEKLRAELGGWYAGPLLWTAAPKGNGRLARALLEQATVWPSHWKREGEKAGNKKAPSGPIPTWKAVERFHSKESWLRSEKVSAPWPLKQQTPAIVNFFSFKGGVGRSTALGIVAWQLATAGKKVVCIDLDLEAPGLARLFGVEAETGVLDYLLSHGVTGSMAMDGLVHQATVHGAEIHVVPAGALSMSFLEKLGRLDFMARRGENDEDGSVGGALRGLLKGLRKSLEPDYILLDSRAGLHDIGGLSLSELVHVDVLLGRGIQANVDGLRLALEVLAHRRTPAERRLVIVQSFVRMGLSSVASLSEQKQFREEVYSIFCDLLYDGDPVDEGDDTGDHYPRVIGTYEDVAFMDSLEGLSPETLNNGEFTKLRRRIEEKCYGEPKDAPASDDEAAHG